MPLYDWACPKCRRSIEILRPMAEALQPVSCDCGELMVQQLSAAYVSPDIAPYRAVTGDKVGQLITSRREHREFLKRNRLVEIGTETPKDTKTMRKIHKKGEMREAIRETTRQLLKPDLKRGGLTERNPTRRA